MKLNKKNEVEMEIKSAEQKLQSFKKDFEDLRAKYPDVRIGDPYINDNLIVIYTHIGSDNSRSIILTRPN